MLATTTQPALWIVVLRGRDRSAGGAERLERAVRHAVRLAPAGRVLVVAAPDGGAARRRVAAFHGVELVAQPADLDTGPGALLALARIRARDAGARVVFLPAEPGAATGRPLAGALARWAAGPARDRIARIGGRHAPVAAGPAAAFWALARQHLPAHAAALATYALRIGRADEPDALAAAYLAMAPCDLERDLVARASDAVVIRPARGGTAAPGPGEIWPGTR